MSKDDNLLIDNPELGGFVISSPQGRSGKTLVTIGLSRLLLKNGYRVQPFKKGPDYIDPSWLTVAARRICRNLDLFLIPKEKLIENYIKNCIGIDIALIEGAMGLYDGLTPKETTAEIAHLLNLPIIMVINTSRMAESISAMLKGYQDFRQDIYIAGIILNNVSGSRHENKLKRAVERYCKVPVVGSIPKDRYLIIPERHLGLVPSLEKGEEVESIVEHISMKIEPHIDLEGVLSIARSLKFNVYKTIKKLEMKSVPKSYGKIKKAKIGVFRDQVFNFYYPENLEALEEEGAELIFINSLKDKLPMVDGLYIGGGFPEFFLERLEDNISLREDIAKLVEEGLPVYAECAGLMYLCQRIYWEGHSHEMVGLIPAEVHISERPEGHGYVVAEVASENPIYLKGTVILGHEFHHSKLSFKREVKFIFKINRGHGIDGKVDGILYKNLIATYLHIHALGTPEWSRAFVSLVKNGGALMVNGLKD